MLKTYFVNLSTDTVNDYALFTYFSLLLVNDLNIAIDLRVAWLVGWSLILEYTIGASAVARGITPNLVCYTVFPFFKL